MTIRPNLTRRDALKLTAAALLASGCSREVFNACAGNGIDELEDALTTLHRTDPEFGSGLANHGPMAAEVLVEQGRVDRVCEWVSSYLERLDPLEPAPPLSPQEQADALGDFEKRAAMIATYEQQLESGDVAHVLDTAWPVLLPGVAASAFHGALRTGHALRSLRRADTPIRRRELAHGLGYWAARYFTLPGDPGSTPVTGRDVVSALDQMTLLPAADRQNGGTITGRLLKVVGFQPFVDAVEGVDLDSLSIGDSLIELSAATTRFYIADAGRADIGYLHAVTGTSALRLMLPWMSDGAARTAIGYVFQTVAAVHATHAESMGIPADTYRPTSTRESLADRGADAADEHTIKLVEALLREHAVDPRPEFLVAAELRL